MKVGLERILSVLPFMGYKLHTTPHLFIKRSQRVLWETYTSDFLGVGWEDRVYQFKDSLLRKRCVQPPKLSNPVYLAEKRPKAESSKTVFSCSDNESNSLESLLEESIIQVELQGSDLWKRFHDIGTEMIITKAGRFVQLGQ